MAAFAGGTQHDGTDEGSSMMILRRGRSVQSVASGLDFEMTLGLGSGHGRRPEYPEPWRPPIEVVECAEELVVRVEIAGLTHADLDVMVEGDELLVRGERTVGPPEGPRIYHESRIRYGPFEVAVRLPFPIAVGRSSAEYVDGLLSVRLPRQAAARVPMRGDASAQVTDRGER
jgi:HSP20 family molecular chaperone IbpA